MCGLSEAVNDRLAIFERHVCPPATGRTLNMCDTSETVDRRRPLHDELADGRAGSQRRRWEIFRCGDGRLPVHLPAVCGGPAAIHCNTGSTATTSTILTHRSSVHI